MTLLALHWPGLLLLLLLLLRQVFGYISGVSLYILGST